MQSQHIMVIGAEGMLGRDLVRVLSEKWVIHGYNRQQLDITKKDQLQKMILTLRPHYIINAAAYTDVERAQEDVLQAYAVNAEGAENLARISGELKIPLIHFSTNFIFDGARDDPYDESWVTYNPINVYGKSKLKGEEMMRVYNPDHYIIRTSHLFGRYGKNFIRTIVHLAKHHDQVRIINDQIGNPTYTLDLAYAVQDLIIDQAPFGIYHLTNTTPHDRGVSWYELARVVFQMRNIATPLIPVRSEEYPTQAQRPKQGTLANTKRPKLRSYQEAVQAYLTEDNLL